MDTTVVFVSNIPFYIYYNYSAAPAVHPPYRALLLSENEGEINLICLDGEGNEVMPYPEYLLALFTYLFEVRGRYKRSFGIRCADGVHTCCFYIDSAHNYGVNVDLCKQIITFNVKLPDSTELCVTDFQGYDLIRLLYVHNLDCFSPEVLGELRFLKSCKNCDRVVAFSYMGALRLVCEPVCDLSAEMLTAIALLLSEARRQNLQKGLAYYPGAVRQIGGVPFYFTSCVAGNALR